MQLLLRHILVYTLVFFAIPSLSFAATVEELSTKGAKAYKAKDYEAAITYFSQAYEKEEVPNLLFNIAKCYEKQKDWDNAIEFYQQFVVAPDVQKKFRKAAMKKIETIQETKEAEELAAQRKLEKENAANKKPEEKEKAKVNKQEHKVSPLPNRGPDHTMAYVVGGTGVALLIGGGAMGLLAQAEESNFKTADNVEDKRSAQDTGKLMAIVADGMYVGGALATAFSIYLFATSESDVPVSAWISPTSTGASVQFNF